LKNSHPQLGWVG